VMGLKSQYFCPSHKLTSVSQETLSFSNDQTLRVICKRNNIDFNGSQRDPIKVASLTLRSGACVY
jgi:hypothetical protein